MACFQNGARKKKIKRKIHICVNFSFIRIIGNHLSAFIIHTPKRMKYFLEKPKYLFLNVSFLEWSFAGVLVMTWNV